MRSSYVRGAANVMRGLRHRPALQLAALTLALVGWATAAHAEDKSAPPAAKSKPAPPKQPASAAKTPAKSAPATPPDAVEAPPELDFLNESLIQRSDGTVTYFYRTNFVTPKDLAAALKASGFAALLSVGKSDTKAKSPMREIPAQNMLVLDGEADAVEMILDAIAYFDVAAPQVFVEAKVIEVTHDSNFEVGLEYLWDRDVAGPDTLFRGAESTLNPPTFLRSGFPPSFPFQGTSLLWGLLGKDAEKYGALGLRLQAMQLQGKAEVLSKPSIIATQGQKATVKTTEERPVIAFQNASRTNETFTASSVKSGVTLTVTPKHVGESFVTLDIEPKVDGIAGLATNRTGGQFAPIRTSRSAKTLVTLGDGETLVIGGLYTHTTTTEKARTPLLSDLPLIGEIFTRTSEAKAKTEIIFMLTPHIVRKTKDLKIIVPPAELERLENADRVDGKDCKCRPGLPDPPKQLPPPPGWGARFLDD